MLKHALGQVAKSRQAASRIWRRPRKPESLPAHAGRGRPRWRDHRHAVEFHRWRSPRCRRRYPSVAKWWPALPWSRWDVLNTQLKTGTPYMLLENVCYRRDVMAALQMVRAGLFGELLHLQGGYQHDLRAVKFNGGNPAKPYGGGVEFGRAGRKPIGARSIRSSAMASYPSHGIGPCAMYTNINRGNRRLRASTPSPQGARLARLHRQAAGRRAACERQGEIQAGRRGHHHAGDAKTAKPSSCSVQACAPVFAGLPRARRGRPVDGFEQLDSHRRRQQAAPVGRLQGLRDKYEHPVWRKYAAQAERRGPWRHGLLRHPRLCRSPEGQRRRCRSISTMP